MKDTKRCTKCGEEKPLSEFYKTKYTKSGLVSACKVCCVEAVRKTKNKKPEKYKYKKKTKLCPQCGKSNIHQNSNICTGCNRQNKISINSIKTRECSYCHKIVKWEDVKINGSRKGNNFFNPEKKHFYCDDCKNNHKNEIDIFQNNLRVKNTRINRYQKIKNDKYLLDQYFLYASNKTMEFIKEIDPKEYDKRIIEIENRKNEKRKRDYANRKRRLLSDPRDFWINGVRYNKNTCPDYLKGVGKVLISLRNKKRILMEVSNG